MSAAQLPSGTPDPAGPREGLLERLALHRPELRAWALYDWANSAFWAIVIAGAFPVFFRSVAAQGDEDAIERFAFATTASLLLIALLSPALGAIADYAGAKKRFLGTFVVIGVVPTAAMFFIREGQWVLAAVLFGVANIGAAGSAVFAEALLPSVARGKELDRVAASGFALGYLSGGLLLAILIAMTVAPGVFGFPAAPEGGELSSDQASLPARVMFVVTALWWAAFSLPILTRVREPAALLEPGEQAGESPVRAGLRRMLGTLGELRRYPEVSLMLAAFLIYNDGILTIIRMASIYGSEIGVGQRDLFAAILLVQFVAAPFSALFGWLANDVGTKRLIMIALSIYLFICLYAWRMSTTTEFYVLAGLVGTAQGGAQALSRSLFASMIPPHKAGQFFGLFGVLEKFAGVLGPAVFGLSIRWSGSSRMAMLSLIVFFVAGMLLLARVDVDAGRRAAAAAASTGSGGRPA